MSIELKIPHVGESITEVQIAEWLKSEGDTVKKDENVAVIDSEKTTFELPAPESGRLSKVLHKAGETVKVGDVIGQIEPAGGSEKPAPAETKPADAAKSGPAQAGQKESGEKTARPAGEKRPAPQTAKESAPVVAEKTPGAREVEPEETAPQPQPAVKPESSAGREEEIVPMSMLRRTAARRLVEAKQQMAMLTTFNEADMSAVQALRKEHQEAFEKKYQVKLGFMSFFVKAVIDALKQFPQLNAAVRENDVVYHNYFDIGVAIASERGLVVPVLRNAERMSFAEVEKTIGDFARRAKDGGLQPGDLEGGTFTITNGGVFGSLLSTPIINPPQSGILGMHAIQERPVAVQGQVVIRPMMYLALTYDHRIVDGREAVLFLQRLRQIIEEPARLLVEI